MRTALALACVWAMGCGMAMAQDKVDDSAAEKLGWKLAIQSYSFNRFTFFESIDKAASVGLKYVEAYPGQKIDKDIDAKMGPGMSADQIKAVKDKLASAGMKLVAFGVTGLSKDESSSRKTFEWCKEMGIEVINSEPNEDAFDTIEKLAKEYNIKVGIHNHPKPSKYWNPDKVLEVTKGRTMIGACADTGHWLRSGLDPVECVKKLEGKIVSSHFKDLNKKGQGAHDVVWGTGEANVKAILAELKRQGFKGPMSIEYEHNWLNSVGEIGQCVQAFHKFVAELK